MKELINQLLEYAEWAESNIYEVPITLPDVLREAAQNIKKIYIDRKDLRNELCLYCGKYRESYKGACNGCRWESHSADDW